MASSLPPKKNAAYDFYVSLVSQADTKIFKASATLAAGDVKVCIDDGAPANLATLPVVDADHTKRIKVSLSSSEMNGDHITVLFSDAAGAEWCDLMIEIETTARTLDEGVDCTLISGDATAANNAESFFDGTGYAGTNNVIPTVTTLTNLPAITANWLTATGIAADAITAAKIATNAIDADALAADAIAEINATVDTALADIFLDRLFAVDYDPAAKPGVATALLNEIIGSDLGVSQFTANSLELAPTGGSAPTAAQIRAEIDANSTQLAAIVADTNELQTDWVNGGRLDLILDAAATQSSLSSLITTVGVAGAGLTTIPWNATWDAEVQSEANDALAAFFTSSAVLVDAIWDEVLTAAAHNVANSAARRLRQINAFSQIDGTVSDVAASTSSFITDLSATVDESFHHLMIVFTSGNLAGQAFPILTYTGATKRITIDGTFTEAPANGDAFSIVSIHIHPITSIAAGVRTNLAAELAMLDVPTSAVILDATGLDAIPTTAPAGVAATFREMLVQTWRRFFKRATKSATEIKTYADNGTSVVTTQAYTSAGSDDDVGAAS